MCQGTEWTWYGYHVLEYQIDREKYGLPAGADDPVYSGVKWPLSVCLRHSKAALKAFGPHVADLFAAGVADPGSLSDRFGRLAAGGYPSALMDAVADFDLVESFKRMAHDAKLKRFGRDGTKQVYEDTDTGRALAVSDTVNGLEHYYAGKLDEVALLWWAMLCENSRPFAALHGWIAGVLQRPKPAHSQQP